MASTFDNLPQEALCRIVEYLASSKQDLRQIQLTNKRCQSIAEAHIYKVVALSNWSLPENILSYLQFVLRPRRGKLVKVLLISRRQQQLLANLDDSFFNMFPNIQGLRRSMDNDYLDWDHLSRTFTGERCKLKEMPDSSTCKNDNIEGYTKMLCSHHQTLEKLDFGNMDASISHRTLQYMNNTPCMIMKAKCINALDLGGSMLQDLDTIINRCPLLEDLYVKCTGKKDPPRWLPDSQHQQLMESIRVHGPYSGFLDVCNYFVTKFPNVQSWYLYTGESKDMKEEDQPSTFDGIMELWKSFLSRNSKSIHLDFVVQCSSISKAIDFFTGSYELDTEIRIEYSSLGDFVYYDASRRKGSNFADIKVRKSALASDITVVYNPIDLGHRSLIEAEGHRMKKLHLNVSAESSNFKHLVHGGVIAHTLDNCPSLASFTIELPFLEHLDYHAVYPQLTIMNIVCHSSIKDTLLLSLSYQVPNLKELTIKASFFQRSFRPEQSQLIMINMPYNSFDKLILQDTMLVYNTGPYKASFEQITVEIALPTQPSLIRPFKLPQLTQKTKLNNEEIIYVEGEFFNDPYYHHSNRICYSAKFLVTCKSIKSFKFSSPRHSLPEVLF